jgi:tetratricopeptide (TPR) repeat protein
MNRFFLANSLSQKTYSFLMRIFRASWPLVGCFLFGCLLAACSGNESSSKQSRRKDLEQNREAARAEQRADLIKMQQRFYQKIDRGERKKYGRKLLAAYRGFIGRFPKDDKVPKYLYEAASLAHNHLDDYQEAVRLYGLLQQRYPRYDKAPVALFKQGVLLTELDEPERAQQVFDRFLERYPGHELASDARKQRAGLEAGQGASPGL